VTTRSPTAKGGCGGLLGARLGGAGAVAVVVAPVVVATVVLGVPGETWGWLVENGAAEPPQAASASASALSAIAAAPFTAPSAHVDGEEVAVVRAQVALRRAVHGREQVRRA
jgi:hypothetical protein